MPVEQQQPAPDPDGPPAPRSPVGDAPATGPFARLRALAATPPPGPSRESFWDSPLRGPWLTSLLGSLLLPMVVVVGLTGFLSHSAYRPDLGANALITGLDPLPTIDWPTSISWLYALNQGTHVLLGLVAIPVLLAKLWSVFPKLFAWPPAASPAQALERLSIALLVGGALFEFSTGVLNVQYEYVFGFSFVAAHYYGAYVFLGALVLHVGVKLGTIRKSYRVHGAIKPLRASLADTVPEPHEPGGLAPAVPAKPTLSRRGLLGVVGGGSALLFAGYAGATIGGPLRATAVFSPRRVDYGDGPNDFQVNKTAAKAGVGRELTGPGWRLELALGSGTVVRLSREELLALPLETKGLPIACVEGWTTWQDWTGIPVRELRRMAGAQEGARMRALSLQERGAFGDVTFAADQVDDADALLALRVNGADLSMDHGFPARLIVPAVPGVHNTKWIRRLEFSA